MSQAASRSTLTAMEFVRDRMGSQPILAAGPAGEAMAREARAILDRQADTEHCRLAFAHLPANDRRALRRALTGDGALRRSGGRARAVERIMARLPGGAALLEGAEVIEVSY